jgi:hypothetical protein
MKNAVFWDIKSQFVLTGGTLLGRILRVSVASYC